MGGKGSKRRRSQVDYKQFSDNWDTIFGTKNKNTNTRCCNDVKECDGSSCNSCECSNCACGK